MHQWCRATACGLATPILIANTHCRFLNSDVSAYRASLPSLLYTVLVADTACRDCVCCSSERVECAIEHWSPLNPVASARSSRLDCSCLWLVLVDCGCAVWRKPWLSWRCPGAHASSRRMVSSDSALLQSTRASILRPLYERLDRPENRRHCLASRTRNRLDKSQWLKMR